MSEVLLAKQSKSEDSNVGFMQQLYADLTKLQEEEDLYWRQRAKVDWLKSGDRNTKFFHASANQKKKHNFIGNITYEMGQHWEEQEHVGEAFVHYFNNLLQRKPLAICRKLWRNWNQV